MANKNLCKYIIDHAPVKLSEVCAALKCRKYNVMDSVVYLAREVDNCPYKITAEQIGKDILYRVKPSPFALAQQFIRNRDNVKRQRTTTNARTSKTNAT